MFTLKHEQLNQEENSSYKRSTHSLLLTSAEVNALLSDLVTGTSREHK